MNDQDKPDRHFTDDLLTVFIIVLALGLSCMVVEMMDRWADTVSVSHVDK